MGLLGTCVEEDRKVDPRDLDDPTSKGPTFNIWRTVSILLCSVLEPWDQRDEQRNRIHRVSWRCCGVMSMGKCGTLLGREGMRR